MTTKDFPKRFSADVRGLWLGRAYMEARDRGLPLPTPDNPAPDRTGIGNPDAATTRWEWDTDLSPQESAAFDAMVAAVKSGLGVTAYQGVSADIDGLRTYLGIATPTAAQTAQATKALIRVLRALLRD